MSDAVAVSPEKSVADLLGEIVEQRFQVEKINAELKTAKSRLAEMERLAASMLESAGVDGIRCHGATWWTGIELHVSAIAEQRDAILAAAKRVGLDAVQVSTSKVKGWLAEEQKRRAEEGTATERYAEGTPFDGLVSEYTEKKLFRRSV